MNMIVRVQLTASLFCTFFTPLLIFGQDPLSCAQVVNYPPCTANRGGQDQCSTFAVFRTNSYYSSLSNFSTYLGITPLAISQANGFPAGGADFLAGNQLLLLPINCRCGGGGFFEADLTKTTAKGESFYSIAQSLEGLASCRGIQDKNPGFTFVGEKQVLQIPVKCACPSPVEISGKMQILLSYPVTKGDTVASLAARFNTTFEKIVSVNSNRSPEFKPENLLPFTTVLIPAESKPKLELIRKPWKNAAKKRKKKKVYIAIAVVLFVAVFSIGGAFFFLQWRKKKNHHHPLMNRKMGADSELQQLGLSVRTTSEKKISFEGSNDESLHRQQSNETVSTTISTKRKTTLVEIYSMDELRKATEDFSSTNLIEDSVFHGRLNGKELAIKKTSSDMVSRIEFVLFQDAIHRHPNILRLLGTTFSGVIDQTQSPDSYLIFEYAKNGSLKDWLHGGLAMKSQFIASCNCFLTWKQRLRICLDVASAMHFMHQVMNPPYIHKNIKSRNVFLDEDFNARIGNFGMSEYVENEGVVCPSIDVYAFGVILMEVLSGKTPASGGGGEIKKILEAENREERLREWMDEALGDKYGVDAAASVAELAGDCVEDDRSLRPTAGDIVDRLTRLVEQDDAVAEGEEERGFSGGVCESSSKPLVQAPAGSCSETGAGGNDARVYVST